MPCVAVARSDGDGAVCAVVDSEAESADTVATVCVDQSVVIHSRNRIAVASLRPQVAVADRLHHSVKRTRIDGEVDGTDKQAVVGTDAVKQILAREGKGGVKDVVDFSLAECKADGVTLHAGGLKEEGVCDRVGALPVGKHGIEGDCVQSRSEGMAGIDVARRGAIVKLPQVALATVGHRVKVCAVAGDDALVHHTHPCKTA